jgi:hypothetical protein
MQLSSTVFEYQKIFLRPTLAGFNLNGPQSILSRLAEESNCAVSVFVEKGIDPVFLAAATPKKSGNCLFATPNI